VEHEVVTDVDDRGYLRRVNDGTERAQ
jgi:hypothetical protein